MNVSSFIKKYNPYARYNPYAVALLRIVAGALFIISGISKAIDPWGFIFKIEDYFAVWNIMQPRTITLVIAIGLSVYEFILGFMLLAGCFKRMAPWLLMLMMAFMLPLTAYLWIADPVDDCGCFGDMWKISNAATFWKNVLIVLALAYLCRYNRMLRRGVYRPAIQWIVVAVLLVYTLVISLYGYNIQPMIDFRPYPVGTNLYAALTGEGDDDDTIMMVYERDGEQREFSVDELPDSTWTFVRRAEQSPAGIDEAEFSIYDVDGDDVTDYALTDEGDMLVLVIPETNRVDIAYTYAINEMSKAVNRAGGSMAALIAATPEGIESWIDMSMADYPCYIAEDTSLKQLARGGMAMVSLRDGVIQWKRTLSAFDFRTVDALGNGTMSIDDIHIDDSRYFIVITIVVVTLLLIIALTQEFIVRLLPKKQKKQLTLQSESGDAEGDGSENAEAESAEAAADCSVTVTDSSEAGADDAVTGADDAAADSSKSNE
ncbi:MAG: DoxX family protein [Barnesiella sp.]|nr:DoxX family protein [Barnesiella sp.]